MWRNGGPGQQLRNRVWLVTCGLAAAILVCGSSATARTDVTAVAAADVDLKVNFQSQAAPVPAGYVRDFGEGFGVRSGADQGSGWSYGWVVPGSSTPLSLVGNGRDRELVSDQRLDTFVHMQGNSVANFSGVAQPGSWEVALPAGSYSVTVSVGDAASIDSTHRLLVEGVVAIDGFVPTAATKFASATRTVSVTDGRLTIEATGGTNTKLDYVDIVTATPSPPDTTPPAAPTGLAAAAGDARVSLSWTANSEPDLSGYNVFRGTSSPVDVSGTPLNGSALNTGTSFVDTAVANGTQYFYVVQAVDSSGNRSASSATVNATPLAPPPPTVDLKVNFQSQAAPVPAGYVRDFGEGFGVRSGCGSGVGLVGMGGGPGVVDAAEFGWEWA